MEKINFQYDGYNQYLYTGLQGYVMKQNHKILSKGIKAKQNQKILEIGGAIKPHLSIIELNGVDEYWISDSREIFDKNDDLKNYNIKEHIYDNDTEYKKFTSSNKTFTRIIASHVWEHVINPEETLLKWISLLDKNGILDIAIPCDPGWAWRLGQLIGRKKASKNYNMTSRQIDLMMTREHINSCQNLIKIIRAYTNKNGSYFPFNIPIVDINLFVFFRLSLSDFK